MPANGTETATLSQIKEYVEYTQTQLEGYVDDAIAGQPSADVNIDKVYPVGSIYMSMSATSPSSLFGGTWQRIEGRFLMASSSSYDAGDTGGSNDAIVVSHSHSGGTDSNGDHSHTISGGSHSHSGSAISSGSHTHTPVATSLGCGWNTTGGTKDRLLYGATTSSGRVPSEFFSIQSSGSHTHTLSIGTSSSHSHTIGSNGMHSHGVNIFNTGSSGTNKNMPSFIAVNVWQRTA